MMMARIQVDGWVYDSAVHWAKDIRTECRGCPDYNKAKYIENGEPKCRECSERKMNTGSFPVGEVE